MASAKQAKSGGKTGSGDKTGINRRKFDRRDTHIVAQLNHDGNLVVGMVTNLSLEGCLFAPRVDIPVGSRIKLKLAGENQPVSATVKAVSDLGVHCLLHAGGTTLGRLSAEVDDMALLMLNAGRPHVLDPRPLPAAQPVAQKTVKKKTTRKPAAKAKAPKATVKKAAKKKTAKKPAPKKPMPKKPVTKKKVVKKKAARRK